MLKLDPNAAQGLHKLSSDIKVLATRQKPEQQMYQVRFSFVDFLKIAIYSVLAITVIKAFILILHW